MAVEQRCFMGMHSVSRHPLKVRYYAHDSALRQFPVWLVVTVLRWWPDLKDAVSPVKPGTLDLSPLHNMGVANKFGSFFWVSF